MPSNIEVLHRESDRMDLLVGSVPSPDYRRLAVVLEGLHFEQATFEVMQENHGAASAARRFAPLPESRPILQADNTRLLLTYARPEAALLAAMQEGGSPAAALQAWRREAEVLLNLWRRNRRNTLLVATDGVMRNPQAFAQAMTKRLGVRIEPDIDVQPEEAGQAFDELHQVIAAQMVAQSDDIAELLAELEAAAVPLGPVATLPAIDCESVFRQLKGAGADVVAEYESLQHKCKGLEEETELLVLQLHQVQEELESYYLELTKARKTISERDAAIRKKNRNLEHHEGRCKLLEAENRKLERELAARNRTLATMKNSTSWKLTRPVRALRLLFAGKPRKPAA